MNTIYLIDLDGTMYRGSTIIEGAKEFIDDLASKNQPFLFLTNNARRTGKQNVEHMEKMGFTGIKPENFFTSSMAAAAHMAKKSNKRKAAFIGEDGLKEALLNNGFEISEEDVDFLFVGLSNKATYVDYSKALRHLIKGAALIGTNSDRVLAQDDGFAIGNGSVVHMFEYASGQKSEEIGKPHAPILEEALAYLNVSKENVAILGDNLETDIKLGVDHGVESIFVTSGVHHEEDIERLQIQPTRIIHSLKELIK